MNVFLTMQNHVASTKSHVYQTSQTFLDRTQVKNMLTATSKTAKIIQGDINHHHVA